MAKLEQKIYERGSIFAGGLIQYRGRMCQVIGIRDDTLTLDTGDDWTLAPGDTYEIPFA